MSRTGTELMGLWYQTILPHFKFLSKTGSDVLDEFWLFSENQFSSKQFWKIFSKHQRVWISFFINCPKLYLLFRHQRKSNGGEGSKELRYSFHLLSLSFAKHFWWVVRSYFQSSKSSLLPGSVYLCESSIKTQTHSHTHMIGLCSNFCGSFERFILPKGFESLSKYKRRWRRHIIIETVRFLLCALVMCHSNELWVIALDV